MPQSANTNQIVIMKKLLLFILGAALTLSACKKDDELTTQELLQNTWEVESMLTADGDLVGTWADSIQVPGPNGELIWERFEYYTRATLKFEADGDVEMILIEGSSGFPEEQSFFLGKYTLTEDNKLTLGFNPSTSENYEGLQMYFDCSIDIITETDLEFDGQLIVDGEDEEEDFTSPVQVIAKKVQ